MKVVKRTDVLVIGGGIVGTAVLRELSKYRLNCLLVEKEPDLSIGTTKANSAILHAGFDAQLGSIKARTNVRGNYLYHSLEKELDLHIAWTGSLVVATNADEAAVLSELLSRGRQNGISGLEILSPEEVLKREPNLTSQVTGALWAPSAGVCWPFGVALAFARCAVQNDAEVWTNCGVQSLKKLPGGGFSVVTERGCIEARYVVNAAGVRADEVARLAGDTSFTISPRKGEYLLFDKKAADKLVHGVIFPTPSAHSKGILVCTTVHGNTFIGPDATNIEQKDDLAVTAAGMERITSGARKLLPNLPLGEAITEFSGLRAVADREDFILEASAVEGLIHAAGMQSPGLTAAPAVAEEVVAIVRKMEPGLELKEEFLGHLTAEPEFHKLTTGEQAKLIQQNSLYGRVICRCETVTEAEIIAAIHQTCGARTVDGVKRRTRAGMGRCQGGFCGPKVTQILARELEIPVTEVLKEGTGSQLFYAKDCPGRGSSQ